MFFPDLKQQPNSYYFKHQFPTYRKGIKTLWKTVSRNFWKVADWPALDLSNFIRGLERVVIPIDKYEIPENSNIPVCIFFYTTTKMRW